MIIVVAIAFSVLILGLILTLLLKRQLREKYAIMWLAIGGVVLILSIWPGLLDVLSRSLGVEVPANLLFTCALALLLGVALHLSWELSRAEDEIRRVAEEVAINRALTEQLRRDLDALQGRTSPD